MNDVMRWIKTNPITVASILVILIALSFNFFVTRSQKNAFRDDVKKKVEGQSREVQKYKQFAVPMLPEKPGEQAENRNIVVTAADVEIVRRQRETVSQAADEVHRYMLQRNQQGHDLLLSNIFPEMPNQTNLPHEANKIYKASFERMFDAFDPTDDRMDAQTGEFAAKLHAGGAADMAAILADTHQIAANYDGGGPLGATAAAADPDQLEKDRRELEREQRNEVIRQLNLHASGIHIYAQAQMAPVDTRNTLSQPYPFEIGPWANTGQAPTVDNLWDGQMSLWIQQDLVRAIALANRVHDPHVNVLNAPVKHLLGMRVNPGYIGLTTGAETSGQSGASPMMMNPMMMEMYGGMGSMGEMPGEGFGEEETQVDPDRELLAPKFKFGLTGRFSNPLYDIRHATLSVIVDARRLHELLQAINHINLMTVLEVKLTDVNEYNYMQQGFFYGEGDLVQADIKIETIWLRQWTQQYMPQQLQINLEMIEDPDAAVPDMDE